MTNSLSPQFGSDEYHRQVAAGEHPPAMFATAHELVSTHNLWDAQQSRQGKQVTLEKKFLDDPELTRDIQENGYDWNHKDWYGYRGPEIQYSTSSLYPVIRNGHHRVAAMYYTRPHEWMPLAQTGVFEKDYYDQNSDHWNLDLPKKLQSKDIVGNTYADKSGPGKIETESLLRELARKEQRTP